MWRGLHPIALLPRRQFEGVNSCKDEEDKGDGENLNNIKDDYGDGIEGTLQLMELPLYSVGGIMQPNTMKLMGEIEGVLVKVMIDSSASHNFIFANLASDLTLKVDSTIPFAIKLGDGSRRLSQGSYKALTLKLVLNSEG